MANGFGNENITTLLNMRLVVDEFLIPSILVYIF